MARAIPCIGAPPSWASEPYSASRSGRLQEIRVLYSHPQPVAQCAEWLLGHAVFMLADSTGVPPRHWTKRGCTVEAFGKFEKSFLGTWDGYQQELRELFAGAKPVPMRFGYPDGSPSKHNHLLISRCPAPPVR